MIKRTWLQLKSLCLEAGDRLALFTRYREKLSEKSRTPLQRSLTRHRNGTFRAVLAFVYWLNLWSKPAPTPFRTVSEGGFSETGLPIRGVLGNPKSLRLLLHLCLCEVDLAYAVPTAAEGEKLR